VNPSKLQFPDVEVARRFNDAVGRVKVQWILLCSSLPGTCLLPVHRDVAYTGLLFHDLRGSVVRDLLRTGVQEKS